MQKQCITDASRSVLVLRMKCIAIIHCPTPIAILAGKDSLFQRREPSLTAIVLAHEDTATLYRSMIF